MESNGSVPFDVLRCCARVECGVADYERLAYAASRVDNWEGLPSLAERHGLAPLVYTHLRGAGVTLPSGIRRQFDALSVHHRQANRFRMRTLREILDAFESAGINALVLKGAALVHVIYPAVELRPMSDLDILVEERQARDAQVQLANLGFNAPLTSTAWATAGRQHMPTATRRCDNQAIHVEIHHDALSRDQKGSLTVGGLTSAPRRFYLEGRPAYALGHTDMLYHLCCHLAEMARLLRLIWIADIIGYATRFSNDIDWHHLRRHYPSVLNTLSLLHHVTPLPPPLLRHAAPAGESPPQGVAMTFKPFRQIMKRGRGSRAILRDVFYPSDWWLRLYYGLDETRPLFWCRWFRHPWRVGSWLAWRLRVYLPWRARGLAARLSPVYRKPSCVKPAER